MYWQNYIMPGSKIFQQILEFKALTIYNWAWKLNLYRAHDPNQQTVVSGPIVYNVLLWTDYGELPEKQENHWEFVIFMC